MQANPWRGRLPAVLASTSRGVPVLQTIRPGIPGPPVRIGGTQQPVGSWKVTPAIGTRAGRNPAEPEPLVPGQRTMPCGHWPFRPRGGVLPVFRESESVWREHDEQAFGRVAAVVHDVRDCLTWGTAPRFGAVPEAPRHCAAGCWQDVERPNKLRGSGTRSGTAVAVLRHIPCAAAPPRLSRSRRAWSSRRRAPARRPRCRSPRRHRGRRRPSRRCRGPKGCRRQRW